MKLIESKTYQNLARAYVGETQAYVRYQFVEYGARNEGYNALAEIVDKVVYNEFNTQDSSTLSFSRQAKTKSTIFKSTQAIRSRKSGT